jgi:hypothetical protein
VDQVPREGEALWPERDAYPQLARLLGDGLRHLAEEADGGHGERNEGEGARQQHVEARLEPGESSSLDS